MPSAVELFYPRRYGSGRRVQREGFVCDSVRPDRNFHSYRRFHSRNPHHDSNAGDLHRRSFQLLSHPFSSQLAEERAVFQLPQGVSRFSPTTSTESESLSSSSQPGFTANNRLPGPVLVARERLLERLRGVSPSGDRHDGHPSIFEAAAAQMVQIYQGSPLDSTSQLRRRPPGLTQTALEGLNLEVFFSKTDSRVSINSSVLSLAGDCSICLESFMDGDRLILLPCQHKFHSGCLVPWILSCGDCPYCRRNITC